MRHRSKVTWRAAIRPEWRGGSRATRDEIQRSGIEAACEARAHLCLITSSLEQARQCIRGLDAKLDSRLADLERVLLDSTMLLHQATWGID